MIRPTIETRIDPGEQRRRRAGCIGGGRGRFFAGLLLLTALSWTTSSTLMAEPLPVPEVTDHIYDSVNMLEADTRAELNQTLKKLEKDKGAQVVVIIIPTTGEESIEEYGIRVAESLAVGRKGVDDGVVLIVAKDDRKVRIEVGYGLEGAIPDAVANRIIQDRIVPAFRAGNFSTGIQDAVITLDKLVRGEALPDPVQKFEDELALYSVFSLIGGIFTLVGVLVPLIVGRWLAITNFFISAGVGFLVYYLTDGWAFGLFACGMVAFFIGIFGTVFSAASVAGSGSSGSGSYSSGTSYSSSSSSSSFSSGFSSSSSFSGGGGSFGGGGASGSW